jgi:nitrite reductase/ring-hydroxylating ferredoxin subunit
VNVDGNFHAVDNERPHRGGSPGEGELNADCRGRALECSPHGSVFDVRAGEVRNAPAADGVRTSRLNVDAGRVQISLDYARSTMPPTGKQRSPTASW